MTTELAWTIVILCGLAAVFAVVAAIGAWRMAPVGGELQRLDRALQDMRDAVIGEFARSREAEEGRARHQREEVGQKLAAGFAQADENAGRLRQEVSQLVATLGTGLRDNFEALSVTQRERLDGAVLRVTDFGETNARRFDEMRAEAVDGRQALREEIGQRLSEFRAFLGGQLGQNAEAQKERLEGVTAELRRHAQLSADAQDKLRDTVQGRLDHLRQENSAKLDEMRATVDEKLQGTLEQRLGESFKRVDEQLKQVHESVGKMQDLATGVGDLKRVLTNVKSRGSWGEASLEALLEDLLTPEQFGRNVVVKPGSGQHVEFAVKLPGGDEDTPCWLPIDSKFPSEDYDRFVLASQRGDDIGVADALGALEKRIRREGSTICQKYISPPDTTPFAIMFLPTEGLYAEVVRRPGLVDALRRDCQIIVAGPTILHAVLGTLQMKFKTLAIAKKSGEVLKVLGAVKTEFGNYGMVLDKVKKKLDEASQTIEIDVARRNRAIIRKLRDVELLPEHEAAALLALPNGATSPALFEETADQD